jgi:hypothetical protein
MSSENKNPVATGETYGRADERTSRTQIEMPGPSYWPMVLAFGIAFTLAGLVTHYSLSILGVVIALRATVGWWREVIPHEKCEGVAIDMLHRPEPIEAEERSVVRLLAGEAHHRASVPEKIHPYSAGVKGGIVGGIAMALLACLYGLVAWHSIWYPVNLLAGVVLPEMGTATLEQLRAFNLTAFVAAVAGHAVISILVGIIYAAILPMFPKYAPLWAGILMPVFWSGLIATTLDVINPALNARINWPSFIVCQLGFGLCGGFVIARSTNIDTLQSLHFASRAFVDAPGLRPPGPHGEDKE